MRRFDDVIVQWARDVTVDKADMIPLLRYSEAGMLDLEDLELYRSMEPTKKHVRSLLYKLDSSCGPKNLRDVPVTQLPVVGVTPANLEECVESGKVGARLLELTAATQAVAGDVVAELGIRKVRRNELFFFTKVQKDVTEEQLTALHEQLNIQSIDMVLLDCEGISSEEARAAWSVLEAVKSANMVRCIGVSQCPLGLYDELVYEGASHHPAVNEISYTLRNPNYDYVKGCANRGMAIIARVSDADLEFDEPKLDELAESVQLTPQQVALSYIAQQGIVPILAVPAEDGDERKLATLLEGVKTIVEFQEEHLDMFEGFAEGAAAPEEAEGEAAAAPNGEAAAEEQADEAAEE
eukprot:TRINITY_DN16702_c0_g1_i1.p1 TRINITY_DN16702_c0_g1~~TRINITY_DN16702_c0_g1_i1.p1  ORF type:complete len:352 (+),score=168.73 TRINITY_DN16702_c0_g1_i1:61-1116(+)